MRNLEDVLNKIIEVRDRTKIVKQLNKVIYDASYTAPELMYLRWREAYNILVDYLFDEEKMYLIKEKEEIGVKVFSIFADKEENEIRKECIRK